MMQVCRRMPVCRRGLTALLGLACLLPTAGADIVYLQDGRILEGPAMQRTADSLVVQYKNGEVHIPADMVLEAVIAGDSTFVPQTEEEKAKFEDGLVPFEGKYIPATRRRQMLERRIADRREMIAKEKEHRVWRNRRTEKTKHFEFEYTVPQHQFEIYRDLMEAYFTAFAKDWKIRQPKNLGKLKTCFYIDREAFNQISGAGGGTLAYFRFVEPMELNFFYDPMDAQFTEDVMFHEANHYLTKLIDVDFHFPHFPGESLAEYYGASDYDPKTRKVTSGLVQEGRLTEIQADIDRGELMSLEKLVSADRMYEHYTWGWSLVHFLMNDKALSKKFQKFVLRLPKEDGASRGSF